MHVSLQQGRLVKVPDLLGWKVGCRHSGSMQGASFGTPTHLHPSGHQGTVDACAFFYVILLEAVMVN